MGGSIGHFSHGGHLPGNFSHGGKLPSPLPTGMTSRIHHGPNFRPCGAEKPIFWRSCGAFCDLTQDLITFIHSRFAILYKNIIVESVGIPNSREFRNSDSIMISMVRLANGDSLPVHVAFHLSRVRQMDRRIFIIPPHLTDTWYRLWYDCSSNNTNWSLWPFAVLSARDGNNYNRIQQRYGSHCGKFPYVASFALESGQSINTRCFPDGPAGLLCPFSRFVLLPGGRWALWAGFPRGALRMTVFPRGEITLPPPPYRVWSILPGRCPVWETCPMQARFHWFRCL